MAIVFLLCSIALAVTNVVVMTMYANSQLGRTPIFLPLILAGICLLTAVTSIAFAIRRRAVSGRLWGFYLFAAAIWTLMIVFNLSAFMQVLYVA